jgi:hypothetical protein
MQNIKLAELLICQQPNLTLSLLPNSPSAVSPFFIKIQRHRATCIFREGEILLDALGGMLQTRMPRSSLSFRRSPKPVQDRKSFLQ